MNHDNDFFEDSDTQTKLIGSGSFSKVYLCIKKSNSGVSSTLQMFSANDVFDQSPKIYVIKKIDSHRLVKKYASSQASKISTDSFFADTSEEPAHTPVDKKWTMTPLTTQHQQLQRRDQHKPDYKQHYYSRVRDLIESELDILALLDHPNVIHYFGYSQINGVYSISLEYCNGGDLYQYLFKNVLQLPNDTFVNNLVKDIGSALKYLHDKNIIHRDIKLQNILLHRPSGNLPWTFKLTDFGFSTSKPPPNLPKTNMTTIEKKFFKICGTPYYMAPELMKLSNAKKSIVNSTSYDHTIDIWSFGVCLYEVLTFQLPFPKLENVFQVMEFLCNPSSVDFINAKITIHVPPQYKSLVQSMLKFDHRCNADYLIDFVCQTPSNNFSKDILDTHNPAHLDDSWIRISGTESSLSIPQAEQFKSTFLKWLLKY